MAATQAERLALYDKMKESWGEQPATTLMDLLPPMDSTEIATKNDVENASVQLRGEMAELRGEMAELRGELLAEFGQLRGEFRASTRHTIVTVIGAAVTIWLTFYLPQVI